MNPSTTKFCKLLLTVALAVAAFLFWRFGYPHALSFQEQLQLFLFDDYYLLSRLMQPGGVARYVAEFLVQFYNNVTSGAVVLALLYVALQQLVWHLMKPAGSVWYGLSFLPVLLFWILMGDENMMPTALVALIMALAAMACSPKGKVSLVVYFIVGTPLLYWVLGPIAVLPAVYTAVRGRGGLSAVVWGVGAVLYVTALIIVTGLFLPYPLLRLFFGLSYYRYVEVMPYLFAFVALLCLILALIGKRLPVVGKGGRRWLVVAGQAGMIVALMAAGAAWGYESRKYSFIEYDYLVRCKQWNAIIAKSEKKQPDLPMSVCATNLALAMNGQLGDRAFQFYQRGIDGLLPPFEHNYATLHLKGEIYFQLGLVNTAQRFAFEAMEATPNYNKSGRAVKRLVETNLINGQYAVARKYLDMLKKTLFYRKWALRTESLLDDEKAVMQHPLYGKMRAYRLKDDTLFSEQEIDMICGQLFLHNPLNSMAMQYLLMCPLLQADIDTFINYVKVVQEKANYNPRHCQEAVAYAFMKQGQQPPQGLVSPAVVSQLQDFVQTYRSVGKGSPQLKPFSNTLWYYLMGEE